jgi:hypothetical protein
LKEFMQPNLYTNNSPNNNKGAFHKLMVIYKST